MSHFKHELLQAWEETWNADERARFATLPMRSDLTPAQLLDKLSGAPICNFAIDQLVRAIDTEIEAATALRNLLNVTDEHLAATLEGAGLATEDESAIRELRARIAALIGAP